MSRKLIIDKLASNANVFIGLLANCSKEEYVWKSAPDKWCLLEVACHLLDEEKEDFRARCKHIIENPELEMPSINPILWATEREYMKKDFERVLTTFIEERTRSVAWLQTVPDNKWLNEYQHPKVGAISAELILDNWLAHDYLHMRQILNVKYLYLKNITKQKLDYAGDW